MPHYRHTQVGTVTLAALGIGAIAVAAGLLARGANAALLLVLLVLLACLLLFMSLTVEIADGMLTARFGIGLIRKRVPLTAISTCAVVRNPWWYGWGIRLTPYGWLYNVSGVWAVELSLTSGTRLRIGTDEPQQLCQAIEQARSMMGT